ncbi:uncharacterized protein LOC144149369 [Haemaphysalis longicornis]
MKLLMVFAAFTALAALLQGATGDESDHGFRTAHVDLVCPDNPDNCIQQCVSKGAQGGYCTNEKCTCYEKIPSATKRVRIVA